MRNVHGRIECGHNSWTKGKAAWGLQKLEAIAASGAWTADDTFTAKICLYETPFIHTVSLKFSGDELRFNSEANVAFGSGRDPELVGTRASNEKKP